MIIEAIATAASLEEAQEKALLELDAPDDAEIGFEIIDLPEKKTFGLFGGRDAKVRAYYDDGKQQPELIKHVEEVKEKAPVKGEPAKKERPFAKVSQASVEKTVSYIQRVVDHMELGEVSIETSEIEDGFCLTLKDGDLGSIIGHRGETLDALQYLASLCCNNDEEGFIRVVLDCNHYRDKREKTLSDLAVRIAKKAAETHRCQSLEPMNPYERRIIHTAVQKIDGVSSWSVSDGKTRRVIIGPSDMEGKDVPRHERRKSGRNNRRTRSSGSASQRANSAPHREKMTDSEDLPLFGRIN